MASTKVRPTPPPRGPALVFETMARPALGALLLGLSGMACGDDGSGDTTAETQAPMVPPTTDEPTTAVPPMPAPTTDEPTTAIPPMIPPDTSTGADTGTSTDGGTEIPPMPGPETTTDDGGSESETGTTGRVPPMPPPMPPPDGGALPDDEPSL